MRRVLGGAHPKTLTSASNLALLLQDKGDLEGAEALLREAVAGTRRMLGDAHSDTRDNVVFLAALLEKRGKRAEARALRAGAK